MNAWQPSRSQIYEGIDATDVDGVEDRKEIVNA
jgi:hypothetical protein